jgi:aminoglycoside 3-N-acetyltransferase
MITYRDLVTAFQALGLGEDSVVIAHASLSSFGEVQGGAEAVLGALLAVCKGLMMPTFTYKTMIIPETGPLDNAIEYGTGTHRNRQAEIFDVNMAADTTMGIIPETLRRHPNANRSLHPILSFAGINVDHALNAQTYSEPLAPIGVLTEAQGWVLLLGVNHTVNTAIHYAERLAGRKQFVRWALTPHGVRECPGFPGCSEGFQAIAPYLFKLTRFVQVGSALVQGLPLHGLVNTVQELIAADPQALLCHRDHCPRCNKIRHETSMLEDN